MKMVLPVDGYRSAAEFMQGLQGTQGDMFWLYKQQGHWHGGIHFFDSFAASAVWQTGSQTGLKSMTDGKIVAWRLNDVYPTIDYKNRPHKFSSTFLLIKSTCTPDTSKPEHALDFYTLWMQIAPLEEYKEDGPQTATVTASSLNIREDNPQEGWVRAGLTDALQTLAEEEKPKYAAPVKKDVSGGLPKNSVVELIEEATFLLNGEPTPFAFVRVKSLPARARSGAAVDESVWISASPEHLKRREPYLPEWMKKARDKGEFNKVVLPEEEITVKAGDIIGHLSYLERPDNAAHRFCHLEVFSQDSRFLDFLNNKAGVTVGEALIQSEAGKKRYSFDERSNTFTVIAVGDDPSLTTAERYTAKGQAQVKEVEGKKWYFIAQENAWLAAEDVAVINQYDLTKRGFFPLEQNDLPQTIEQTPMEGWLHKVFQRLRQLAEENRADLYSSGYIEGYKRLLRQMDSNRDGALSESEVWQFLHNRQPHILNQVHRFVVKHHSEWLRDGVSELWRTALADQAETHPELAVYLRKFIDALVWMKDVPEIHSGEALWHMHPVVFLDAIKSNTNGVSYEQLKLIFPQASDSDINAVVAELTGKLEIFKLDTLTRLRHFFAQIKGEVGSQMKGKTEGFQFSPATLRSFSRYYRAHPIESETDGYEKNASGRIIRRADEQAIGRKHYLRLNGNRQSHPDDGYNFRGRGLIQITGYEKYHDFMSEYNNYWQGIPPDTVEYPEKINEMPYAIQSALWFWIKYKPYRADQGRGYNDVPAVTLVVNGGNMGLAERKEAYRLCEQVFL